MDGIWSIQDSHLQLAMGDRIIVPSAGDVFKMLSSGEETCLVDGISCINILKALPTLKFSKVGSQIKCEFSVKESKIYCDIFAQRLGERVSVFYANGKLCDNCVQSNSWFFVNGLLEELQDSLSQAGIYKSGFVSISSYLQIVKDNIFSDFKLINDCVDISKIREIDAQISLPINLKATLYPYQEQGYNWMSYMLKDNSGCLLGDEMGLGKTIQVITLILDLVNNKKGPILVIAPVSLLANWKAECEKFAPSLMTLVHHGNQRTGYFKNFLKYDVIISAYSTVMTDFSLFSMIDWELIVLDEAQNIKNPNSKRTKIIKKLKRRTNIAVTGTPFENHISDVWSLVDFIFPGLLGSLNNFEKNVPDTVEGGQLIEPIITPLILRRLVKDVAKDLPEKVLIPQPLAMSDSEILGYNKERNVVSDLLSTEGVTIQSIQRLRMFCTHPMIVNSTLCADPVFLSVKYQRLVELLEEILSKGEKTIIFTSFTKMIDIMLKDLPSRFKVKTMSINGETPIAERQHIVGEFNEYPRPAILILNPKAAGVGLNITGANHVIHYNLEWNPAVEDQASARAYRRGQKKTVFIYRLFYENTVEEVMNDRLTRKRDLATNAIIGNDGRDKDRQDILDAINRIPKIL